MSSRPRLIVAVAAIALAFILTIPGVLSIGSGEDPAGTGETPESEPTVSLLAADTRISPEDQHLEAVSQEQDAPAGVLSRYIPVAGTAHLTTVAGTSGPPAVAGSRHHRFRVETEDGLPVDPDRFAEFVVNTLNDPRGWGGRGHTFERTDGSDADFELILASPQTSEQMCSPLGTFGIMSCRQGNKVILTWYRWAVGIPDYGTAITDYRRYVVNHEVGHYLGFDHQFCPGADQPAPLMMQQTKGLDGCLPNPWP